MTRALLLAAALAAGLAFSAFAGDTGDTTVKAPPAAEGTNGPAIENIFTSDQARKHLMQLGYTNISALEKDADGKWIGTATKDGKTVAVAVDIKGEVIKK